MKIIAYRVAAAAILCIMASGGFVGADNKTAASGEAVALLKGGNERFVRMKLERPNLDGPRRKAVAAEGQKPFAVVLGCSDSRVPVEEIFDRGIGDIFVIRVAGNVAMGPAVIGSAEYAVEHLGAPLLVVLGHTGCGAAKAAISGTPLEGSMRDIQLKIEPVAAGVKESHPELKGAALEAVVVRANVLQAKSDLLSKSEEIREMAGEGRVRILTAIYDINTGAVEWMDDNSGAK